MLTQTWRVFLLASLALFALAGAQAYGQGTQLGSYSGRSARLAQFDGEVVGDGEVMGQPGMMMQPGGDVWGDDAYEQQGWSSNLFGVPSGQSCQGRGAGFVAGGGAYFIKPMWTNNQAAFVATQPVGAGTTLTRYEIDNDHEWSPFVFAGFVGPNGFGVRGRAWMYEQAANDTVITVPALNTAFSQSPLDTEFGPPAPPFIGPGIETGVAATGLGTLRVSSNLRIYVYDLEAIQAIDHEQWTWTFSGGVRYGIIKQTYIATATLPAFNNPPQQIVGSTDRFGGWGPTLSLEGKRSFGQTGLAVYGNARGSLLFGNSTQEVNQSSFVVNVVPPVLVPGNTATSAQWSLRPILELEVGGEYGYWLGSTARLFIRAGLVGQVWFNAGNAANAGLAGGADDNANMGFTGYRATAGIDY